MSLFLVTSEEVYQALQEAVEWTTRVRVTLVQPNIIETHAEDWFMEYTSAFELREVAINWSRNAAGKPPEDLAMVTMHFLNSTGGVPDASWTTADYESVETKLDALWTALKGMYSSSGSVTLAGYTWRADGPAFKPFGASLSPTLRITNRSVAGLDPGEQLPPQVAVSVTEVIPSTFVAHNVEGVGDQTRNRWGRFYLPAPVVSMCDDGRPSTAFLTNVANAVQTFYNACVADDFIPVVYSPTTGHAWSIDEIHVDDVFDVIRSRRFRNTLSRNARAIDAV
jgi:hypothetical protein